jgi:SNF2 family DNA or RNA helicase
MLIPLLIAMRHRARILGERAKPSLEVVPAHLDIQWNRDLSHLLGVEYTVHRYKQIPKAAATLFDPRNSIFTETEENDPSTHVVLVTYPRLQRLTPHPRLRGLFGNVFCDEAHALKNFMGTK